MLDPCHQARPKVFGGGQLKEPGPDHTIAPSVELLSLDVTQLRRPGPGGHPELGETLGDRHCGAVGEDARVHVKVDGVRQAVIPWQVPIEGRPAEHDAARLPEEVLAAQGTGPDHVTTVDLAA